MSNPNGSRHIIVNAHESGKPIGISLATLAFPSIFLGYFLKDLFLGLGTPYWGNALFTAWDNNNIVDAEFIETSTKLFPVILSTLGALSSYILYRYFRSDLFELKQSSLGRNLYIFFNRKP